MDQTEKRLDQAEKRTVRYLKRRFKTDSIKVESVWPCDKSTILVEGSLKDKHGPSRFHVMVGLKDNILGWKVHEKGTEPAGVVIAKR